MTAAREEATLKTPAAKTAAIWRTDLRENMVRDSSGADELLRR
jgi:hypothetical protein